MQQEEAHSDTTNTCGCVEFSEVSQDVEAEAQLECWPSQDEVVEDKIVTTSAGDVHNVGESIVMRGSWILVLEEYGARWYQPGVYCARKKRREYTSLHKAYVALK